MKHRRGRWIVAGLLAGTAAVAIGWIALSPEPLRVADSKKVLLDFNLAACERRLGRPPTRREWYPREEGVPLYLIALDSQGNPDPRFHDIPDEMAEWESSAPSSGCTLGAGGLSASPLKNRRRYGCG